MPAKYDPSDKTMKHGTAEFPAELTATYPCGGGDKVTVTYGVIRQDRINAAEPPPKKK